MSLELTNHVQMLNIADFPDLERSQPQVELSVKAVLIFARELLEQWPLFAEMYSRTATNLVGFNALNSSGCSRRFSLSSFYALSCCDKVLYAS